MLERALTHRSWAHEQVGAGAEDAARQMHNEAMEFVGDSVLGMIVAEYLFRRHPELTEGELSRMKHRLVSMTTLCRAATRLDIGNHLRFGKGEEKTGGSRKRALLADSFEAVLAAIFFDAGIEAAREFVHRTLRTELEDATPEGAAAADTKTMLQERLQAESRSVPVYEVVETTGPAHRRTFQIEASWDGGSVRATGNSIKVAEMRAAKLALQQLDAGTTEENSSSITA
ncbi:MAG: ribonuclease III [Acidobacteriota bacterium]|nr:ribonuclease III [Acidobacteriota bacterium]